MSQWERLGQLVISRRVQLGYKTRQPFAEALGISMRTLGDIETGRREKYEPNTIAALENTLQWAAGSVQRIIDGEQPIVARGPIDYAPASDTVSGAVSRAIDEGDDVIRRVAAADIPADRKHEIIEMLLAEKRNAELRRAEHAEQLIRLVRGEH